jgi:hypothetical protein
MMSQIQNENSFNETARYHDAQIAQAQKELKLEQDKFAWQKTQAAKTASSASSSKGGGGGGGAKITKKEAPKSTGKKITATKSFKQSTADKKESKAKVDTKSVLDLGYGPISAKKLNQLVSQGKAKEYVSNGKLKFKKTFNY